MWWLLWWECTLCRSNVKWTRDWKVQPRRKCPWYYKYGHSRNFWREGSWIRFMDSSIEHVLPQMVYCMASKEQRWNLPKPCRAYCPLWPLSYGMDVLLLDHVDVDVLQRLPHHHHDFGLLFRPAPVQLYTACCGGHPSCTSWLHYPWLCITCLPYLLLPLYSFPSLNCSSRLCSFRTTTVFITTSIDATPLQTPKIRFCSLPNPNGASVPIRLRNPRKMDRSPERKITTSTVDHERRWWEVRQLRRWCWLAVHMRRRYP